MSKIILTNNSNWYKQLKAIFEAANFDINVEKKINSVNPFDIVTYHKINFKNENFYARNEDFICCCGTYIYKKLTGKDGLEVLFDDLVAEGLEKIRKQIIGCYAIIYKIGKKIECLVDEMGTYAFYYFYDQSNFVFTNTFYHIQKVSKQEVDINYLTENLTQNCIIGKQTPFRNIFRIMGDEIIEISVETGKISKRHINSKKEKVKKNDLDEIVHDLNNATQTIIHNSKCVMANPTLFLTGGVDSRLVLANYIASGIKPMIGAWHGAYQTMNTKDADYNCVKRIAEVMELEFKDIVLNDEDCLSEISKEQYDKLGEYALIYNGNLKWHSMFEDLQIEFADFGYFGETLKEWSDIRQYEGKSISLEEYIDVYKDRTGLVRKIKDSERKKSFVSYLQNEILDLINKEELNSTNLSNEDCMILYCWYRLHADTVVYNLANMYCFSYPVFAQKELVDRINAIDYFYKLNEKLNLKLQLSLCPELLDIPFYSHCQDMHFDKKALSLKEKKSKQIKNEIIDIFKFLGVWNTVLEIYHKFKCNSNNSVNDIRKEIVSRLYNSKLFQKLEIECEEKDVQYISMWLKMCNMCNMIESVD